MSTDPTLTTASAAAILDAVAAVAQRLLTGGDWRKAMPDAMARLGEASGASRAHVFRNHLALDGRLLASQLFEWCAPGVDSYIDDPGLQDYDYVQAGYGRWIALMERGEAIHGIVASFPAEERPELEAEGVVSTLSVPIFSGDQWWGTIGLDDCANERDWEHGEIEALRSAAGIIGASVLRERAEHEYRALVEQGPMITYREHLTAIGNPRVHYVSPQIEGTLGYPVERWQDPGFWYSILHPDDAEAMIVADNRSDETSQAFDMEYRVIAADGRTVWLHDRAIPQRDQEDTIIYWQGFMLDVTGRKQAETELAEAEERYRFLVERGPLATYLLDFPQYPQARPLYLSPQFEDIFGYPLSDWNDPGFWDSVVYPDDREALHADDLRAMEGGSFDIEYRMIAADGRTVWIQDTAEVVTDADGSQLLKGYVMDITQRRRAMEEREAALEQERRAKERVEEISGLKDVLLQAVAHDIRTPLTAILGMATTLAQAEADLSLEERREFAERIAINTTRLDRLVSDLLDLDRLSRGELHANLLTVDLAAIARETATFADTRGRELVVETAPAVVQADPAKIERIVDNLLGNAAKHTPSNAHIWLTVDATEGGALLTVEDDGPGVPDADRERIFDIYHRGSAAPGSGVGLSLVARFAELHGGRAWVAERPGGGASFRVWLPSAPAL